MTGVTCRSWRSRRIFSSRAARASSRRLRSSGDHCIVRPREGESLALPAACPAGGIRSPALGESETGDMPNPETDAAPIRTTPTHGLKCTMALGSRSGARSVTVRRSLRFVTPNSLRFFDRCLSTFTQKVDPIYIRILIKNFGS